MPASADGYRRLLAVAREHVGPDGRLVAFGVEGTGSYGIGLARFLRRHGYQVVEVNRPPRKGERRLSGMSDTLDAEHAARQVLAGGQQLAHRRPPTALSSPSGCSRSPVTRP